MKKSLLIFALLLCAFSYAQLTVSTTSIQNVSCFGGSNGSAHATVSGGTGPYTYTWMPGNDHTSYIGGVPAGTYTVFVTDALGATGSAVRTLTQPTALTATSTQTNAVCNYNGVLHITASGGTAPYTYSCSGVYSNHLTGLAGGNYTYYVTDANACTVSNSVTIGFSSPISLSMSTTSVTCFGTCNGSATVTATGGMAPYTYTWTNSSVTHSVLPNVCGGKKTVTVNDANGCIQTQTTTVAHLPFSASLSYTNVSCNASCNGGIAVSVSGGAGPSYSYLWSPGGQTSPVIPNACVGNYSVVITDGAGCQFTRTGSVSMTGSVAATFSGTNTSCFGVCDGVVQINASGGAGASYSISSTPPGINAMNNYSLCAGVYTVTITAPGGSCPFVSTYTVTEPPLLAVTMSTTSATCGDCNGTAITNVSGGTAPYSYASSLGTTTYSLGGLCPGSYNMNVTDSKGCGAAASTSISNVGASMAGVTATITPYNESCYLSSDGSVDLTISGAGPAPLTYSWSNGATTQDLVSISSGSYCVSVSNASMACANFCISVVATGTNCGSISGNVFFDANSDCVNNGSDVNFPGTLIVVNPGNRLGYTDPSGNYNIGTLPFGSYSVSVGTPSLTTVCSSTLSASVSSVSPNAANHNFAISSTVQPDLRVSVTNNGVVPGFSTTVTYFVKNLNTTSTGGIVKARLAAPFIAAINSVSPSTHTISGDTLIWNLSNIPIPAGINFVVNFTTPLTTQLGTTFTTCATVTSFTPDINLSNNSTCFSRIVTGSFDPNDKRVSPVGVGPEGNITIHEKELNYHIRFQNTGNGPAVNIVVRDTLSPYLDVMSLEMLSVSHNYEIDILPGNILRWRFDNIMLADSNSNEPASHGHIQYRIKIKPNNPLGTEIKNTAYIYFDFNDPVVTNTALNTIWEPPVGIDALTNSGDTWLVYPNPASNVLYLKNASATAEGPTQLELTNAMGQVLHTERFSGNAKAIDLSAYASGVYFVKLVTEERSTMKRIVIAK